MAQRADRNLEEGKGAGRPYQAGAPRRAALLAALLGLTACVGSPTEGPVEFWRNAFGAPLQGRPLPPGAEGEYPNLASVPPLPPRGAASEREALSRSLADARAESRMPVEPGQPVPPPPAGAESAGVVPLRPPAPPRLAAAPRVRPAPAQPTPPEGAPPEAAPPVPADPGAPPPPPPAEFLAPPPPRL